jgi:hypothetical protein
MLGVLTRWGVEAPGDNSDVYLKPVAVFPVRNPCESLISDLARTQATGGFGDYQVLASEEQLLTLEVYRIPSEVCGGRCPRNMTVLDLECCYLPRLLVPTRARSSLQSAPPPGYVSSWSWVLTTSGSPNILVLAECWNADGTPNKFSKLLPKLSRAGY